MTKLKNWFFKHSCGELLVCGDVFDSLKFDNGKTVQSSAVLKVDKFIVETLSGSLYFLSGPPEKEYKEYLDKNGLDINNQVNNIDLIGLYIQQGKL